MKKTVNRMMNRAVKQFATKSLGKSFGALVAVGILIGSTLLGNVQSAAAVDFGSEMTVVGGVTLLANAGGRELRNSIDDKYSTAYGNKIDVNNTNIAAFTKYRGLYPTIAGKVISNAPYDSVEDILEIPGLRQVEKDRIKQNMDVFTISDPDPALVEGADRFNNGIYK